MNRLTTRDIEGCPINLCGGYLDMLRKLAAYEDTGLEPEEAEACKVALMGKTLAEIKEIEGLSIERMKELAKAESEGRLFVLPWATDITIERGGLLYKGDHWNPPILTAFADDLTTRTGKRVCLFSVEDVKYAEAALRGGADG